MSLFQCEVCGCCENSGLSPEGFWRIVDDLDWSAFPERKGMQICSVCSPDKYLDGSSTGYGLWHGQFKRVILPKGMFVTNKEGNLAHKDTGDENYHAYEIMEQKQ